MVAVIGCEASPPSGVQSELRSGLVLRGGERATPNDHLVELVVHEGHVYVGNSNYGLSAMRLEPDGSLTLTQSNTSDVDYPDPHRCTSLAIHRSSDTLYCASDWGWPDSDLPEDPKLTVFDLSEPGNPIVRQRFALGSGVTRDLEVVGDRLLLHHFDEGLWTVAIEADGSLGPFETKTAIEGNARVSVGLAGGARIATLFSNAGGASNAGSAEQPGGGAQLRLYTADFVELDRLDLAGPALGLGGDESGTARLVAALGSGGLALIDTADDHLVVSQMFTPPAVVNHAVLDGDRLFAITLSGAFAWVLSESGEARMIGFGPSGDAGPDRAGNMLHGVVHEGELITSDWLYVERWAIDPAGVTTTLDVPRGLYVGPSGPIQWQARNVGNERLRVEFKLLGKYDVIAQGELEPGATGSFEIAADARAGLLGDEPVTRVVGYVYDGEIEGPSAPLSSTLLVIVVRGPDQDPAQGRPAPGDRFPKVALQSSPETTFEVPTPEGGQTVFFSPDCALMWPQLQDMAWLSRIGQLPREGPAILISQYDVAHDGFAERYGLWGASFGYYGPYASAEVAEHNAGFAADVYESFFIQRMPGDAMPTDYSIGADGIVRSVERMYRGPWTLRVPWQPD